MVRDAGDGSDDQYHDAELDDGLPAAGKRGGDDGGRAPKIEGLPAKDLKVRHLPPGPPEVQGHPDERHQDGQEHARLEQHADDALDLLVLPEPHRGGRAGISCGEISHARRHR